MLSDLSAPKTRSFCWDCHRPETACFCAQTLPFKAAADFAMVVHPDEANSTVGTAWILRKSISNLHWFRSKGSDLDTDPRFLELLNSSETEPFLLFPSPDAINLDLCTDEEWKAKVPSSKRPLFFIVDGTWTQAPAILRKSSLLRSLPRVSFQTHTESMYGFKKQPHPQCLSCVEGVHQVIEKMARRGWADLPLFREHDRMIEIFKRMVDFQLQQERAPRSLHLP